MAVYYEGRGDDRNLQPFPPGFRMVSGDKNARSYKKQPLIPLSDRPIADRVSFACLDGTPNPEQPGMVNTNCKDGLRAQIHFQSCWNGKDLYKSDNSHVEYMSGLDNGKCPSTHPVPLMHLFYEVLYGVNDIKKDNGGRFLFSNGMQPVKSYLFFLPVFQSSAEVCQAWLTRIGDPTGYGYHGDFLNGWKANILTDAVNQCAFTASGAVEDCAPFKPSLDPNFAKSCPELPSLVNEPVHGMLAKLPGCITITPGPQDATDADYACAGGQSSVKESLQSLNSSLGSVTNLTGVTSTFVSKVSSIKAANTETPGSVTSASVQTTASSQADNQGDDNEDESLEQRSIPDEYGSYPYEFPPTVTSRRPEIPNGSPFPHHHHSKRSESHGAVPGDDSYSYNFEQPSTTTSHRPWIPHGSPAPHRRPDKRRVSLRKIKTSR